LSQRSLSATSSLFGPTSTPAGKRRRAAREQQTLERRLEFTGTDAFIEREARRLGLVRPGERLFIVKGVERSKKAQIR
jgi:hypothetical protein